MSDEELEYYTKITYLRCLKLKQHHMMHIEACITRKNNPELYPQCKDCRRPLRQAIYVRIKGAEEPEGTVMTKKVRRRRQR